ncbi:MAG: aminoacyl-histidine dipeptidase [Rhodocyclaceae bacterium]|nr:MAG: aminoacyl-histidine dipeptidase [Rhodocyclaceae bacterium]
MAFPSLEPRIVWRHFATLCAIPRPSKHEDALRNQLRQWAEQRGLTVLQDEAGNLILRKPATPGMEDRKTVTLQGHIDMVCQKNDGTDHDFHRDPIRPVLKDGWLAAEDTTLGADNGIGVALALAALEADDLAHGPLEVLLTVDEEAGMGGARNLPTGLLQGELLLNIDTEEWGALYLGCAGGMDTYVTSRWLPQSPTAGHVACQITVKGLTGGHSGIDIHRERGHAIKLLVRLLRDMEGNGIPLALASFKGGTSRNALPREATALVVLAPELRQRLQQRCDTLTAQFRSELAGVDEGVTVIVTAVDLPDGVMPAADKRRIMAALHAAPQGIKRWSLQAPDVVETSLNLGVVNIGQGDAEAVFMLRSLVDTAAAELAAELSDLFLLAGMEVQRVGAYPGWKPEPASPLLALTQEVFRREFGTEPEIKVIHAGLECGLIGGKYPYMDMISFGPDIVGAHAPGERVHIESVARCWQLLRALLAAVPPRGAIQ